MSKINKEENPMQLEVFLDNETLTMICSYCLTMEQECINNISLTKVKDLFTNLSPSKYMYNEEAKLRVEFIRKIVDYRLRDKIASRKVIINLLKNDFVESDLRENLFNDINDYVITRYIAENIDAQLNDKLEYGFIRSTSRKYMEFFEKLNNEDFDSERQAAESFQDIFNETSVLLRKTKKMQSTTHIDLTDEVFIPKATKIIDKLKSPSNKLKTGAQRLNEMLGGGFEKTRLYLFLGLTGGFKSGLLLTLARWLKLYNMNYKCSDSTARPTVLYLTQENTIEETIERLFNMVTSGDIRFFDTEEAIKILRDKGNLKLTTTNNIDIVMRYYANESIDTDYLYTIADELEQENRELICCIHDYIIRMKPANSSIKETRDKIGAVSNEFKNFAIAKDIPFITAAQLNRDGARAIDNAGQFDNVDMGKMLGRQNVAESWALMQNVDAAFIIFKEYCGNALSFYLSFSRVKIRYRTECNYNYFAQPFRSGNEMQLLDDIDRAEPLGVLSLKDIAEDGSIVTGKKKDYNDKIHPALPKRKTVKEYEAEKRKKEEDERLERLKKETADIFV